MRHLLSMAICLDSKDKSAAIFGHVGGIEENLSGLSSIVLLVVAELKGLTKKAYIALVVQN